MLYSQSEVAKRLNVLAGDGLLSIELPRTAELIAQDARQHNVLESYDTRQFVQWLNDLDLAQFPDGTDLDVLAAAFDSAVLPVDPDAPKP